MNFCFFIQNKNFFRNFIFLKKNLFQLKRKKNKLKKIHSYMILLKNANYLNSDTFEIIETNIVVENGKNGKISFFDSLASIPSFEFSEIIDCNKMLVTKSFANAHHHIYSTLSRGMPAPKRMPRNFYETLKYIWWTLDKSLDLPMIEASALVAAINSAKAGVGFVIDHHASPYCVEGALDTIANAFNRVGVGHLLCYEISDRDGEEIAKKGLAETENYLKTNQALVGLHASFTVSDNTLNQAVALAKNYNSGIHIHVAEDLYDQQFSIANYGKSVVERLNDFGVLNFEKTILGHCLHLSNCERKMLANSPAWIVQNVESNMNNNVGRFSTNGLNNNIMLGTDGMHNDMLRSSKAAFLGGQGVDNIDFSETYRRFRNVHNYLKTNKFNSCEDNSLVVLNYLPPTPITKENFLAHFIFGLEATNVEHLIVGGKLILKNKQTFPVDENEIMQNAQIQAKRLWAKMKTF